MLGLESLPLGPMEPSNCVKQVSPGDCSSLEPLAESYFLEVGIGYFINLTWCKLVNARCEMCVLGQFKSVKWHDEPRLVAVPSCHR